MSAPVNQDVVDKIKKLLSVDETKGSSQHEHEQALMAAQRLALRHGINLDEIDTSESVGASEPVVGEDFTPDRTGGGKCSSRLPTSHKYIAWILEKFFRVELIYISKFADYEDKGVKKFGRVRTLQVFGKKTNVQIALYVYGFLHREFSMLWHEHKRKTNAPMASRNSFFYGLYVGLHGKLLETMGEIEKEADKQLAERGAETVEREGPPPSMALILVDEKQKIADEIKAAHPRLKYIRQDEGTIDDFSAVREGRAKGEKIEIKTSLK